MSRREPWLRDSAVHGVAHGAREGGDEGGGCPALAAPRLTALRFAHVYLSQARRDLRGKTLGCFCVPLSCHGHVLARVANSHNDEELLCQLVR